MQDASLSTRPSKSIQRVTALKSNLQHQLETMKAELLREHQQEWKSLSAAALAQPQSPDAWWKLLQHAELHQLPKLKEGSFWLPTHQIEWLCTAGRACQYLWTIAQRYGGRGTQLAIFYTAVWLLLLKSLDASTDERKPRPKRMSALLIYTSQILPLSGTVAQCATAAWTPITCSNDMV